MAQRRKQLKGAPVWTNTALESDRQTAIERFRESRISEPLERYLEVFDSYQGKVEDFLETTVDLSNVDDEIVGLLSDAKMPLGGGLPGGLRVDRGVDRGAGIVRDPRTVRLARVLGQWLPASMAEERANNIAAALLIEERLVASGEDPDPEISVAAAVRGCLTRPDLDARLRATEDQVAQAIEAWTGPGDVMEPGTKVIVRWSGGDDGVRAWGDLMGSRPDLGAGAEVVASGLLYEHRDGTTVELANEDVE